MRTLRRFPACFFVLLAPSLLCVASIPALARGTEDGAGSSRPNPIREKKVFTNDDLEALAGRIAEPTAAQPAANTAPSTTKPSVATRRVAVNAEPLPDEKNPLWYAQRMVSFDAEVARIDDQLQQLRQFRTSWTGSGTPVGLVLNAPCEGITTDNRIDQLILHRREVQQQIDELSETARRNGFLPGLLREAPELVQAAESSQLISLEQEQAILLETLQSLEDDLAQVQGVIKGMEDEAAARRMTLLPPTPYGDGSLTADLLKRLQDQASALRSQISATEDDARHAGIPPRLLP